MDCGVFVRYAWKPVYCGPCRAERATTRGALRGMQRDARAFFEGTSAGPASGDEPARRTDSTRVEAAVPTESEIA
jgi:hypothetical protein